MIRILILTFLLVGAAFAEPGNETPSTRTRFEDAYSLLIRADNARDNGSPAEALRLYNETLASYTTLHRAYPDWEPGVAQFRITYCQNQIETLTKNGKTPPPFRTSIEEPTFNVPPPDPQIAAPPAERPPFSASSMAHSARILLLDGETDAAQDLLMQGLQLEPDNIRLRLLIATSQCMKNDFENACHTAEALAQDFPSNALVHVVLSSALFGTGRIQEATDELEKALKIEPGLAAAHYDLAQVLRVSSPDRHPEIQRHYSLWRQSGGAADPELETFLTKKESPTGTPSTPAP